MDNLLSAVENAIWKTVQQEEFAPQKASLRRKDVFSNSSKIASLAPFLDDNELIRAKGRLRKADLDYKDKHPVILPSKHESVELLLVYQHKLYHHKGMEYVRSRIQKNYWILGLRKALRADRDNCVKCTQFGYSIPPQMSGLPIDRVTHSVKPFTHTGVTSLVHLIPNCSGEQ